MKRRLFRRCANAPGTLAPEDQAVVDAFRSTLAALKHPTPWTPGSGQDIAVRVGPFIERGHPRPGDDRGPDAIALALQHPDVPYARYGDRYTRKGWLRCETSLILGTWQPAYRILTHAAAGLDLPTDVGLPPAHYAVHITRPGRPLLRIGPYTQCHHADRDATRLRQQLQNTGGASTVTTEPIDFDAIDTYQDPHDQDVDGLLAHEQPTAPSDLEESN
ncbi:hypothetical protein [Streptomyces syringium]|uniref:hypothetical protein n=1 Tax=Streptomyces syringium TaxID=76729 RepID=UPI0034159799